MKHAFGSFISALFMISALIYVATLISDFNRSTKHFEDLIIALPLSDLEKDPYQAALALNKAYQKTYEDSGGYMNCRLCYSEEEYMVSQVQLKIDDLVIDAIEHGDVRAIRAVFEYDPDPRIAERLLRERSLVALHEAAMLPGAPLSVRMLADELPRWESPKDFFYTPER